MSATIARGHNYNQKGSAMLEIYELHGWTEIP